MSQLLHRARQAWAGLAGDGADLRNSSVSVVVDPEPWIVRAGWCAVVALGNAALAVVPGPAERRLIEDLAGATPPAELPHVDWRALGATTVRGPAELFFTDGATTTSVATADARPVSDPAVLTLIAGVDAADAEEAGLADIASPAFVVERDGMIVSAAGYRRWPQDVAHLSVLTARNHRRRGYGATAAAAAIDHALGAGLLPQWRARRAASQRLAAALGLVHLGAQVAVDLGRRPGR